MNNGFCDLFAGLWKKHFPGASLPVTFELIDGGEGRADAERLSPGKGHRCLVCDMVKARKGRSIILDSGSITCSGGRFYTGYEKEHFSDFRYFLSSGKPGEMEGERYKIDPETVDAIVKDDKHIPAEGKEYLFKRWDMLTGADNPDVVIFFAKGEFLSGLFSLANFDRVDPNGVICPFGSGCSSIIHHPWFEGRSKTPRAVLGMFDPSARPCVPVDELTFAVPFGRFEQMVSYMEESFLITGTWGKVKKKIGMSAAEKP